MPKKSILVVIFSLIILGLGFFGYFNSIPELKNKEGNLPKIEIEPKTFNFGKVNYGKVLIFSFKIKNIGKKVLEIKKVATSCACTTAKARKKSLEPGEETELLVKYDTGAMSGFKAFGRQERIIWVKSNDYKNPQAEVRIQAFVE